METAPWRGGEKKEAGHGCYSNEIRREKIAIRGNELWKTFAITRIIRGSRLSFRVSFVQF